MKEFIYQRFVAEQFNADGTLKHLKVTAPDDFNFSFDVLDELAENYPNKLAMLWTNDKGAEKRITFKDLADNSKRVARTLSRYGLKRGDKVLLILKRHYQFWYTVLALHRLGCVGIPATNQLMEKDVVYRFEKARVKAVVCTADGDISAQVDQACEKCSFVDVKMLVGGRSDGWIDFDGEYINEEPVFPRPSENAPGGKDVMLMYFTSGTTGYPKVCMLDYFYPLGHIITARYWHKVDPEGLHLTLAETGWGKAIWGKLYGQFLCEAAVFVYDFDKFAPVDILDMIGRYQITTVCAPPTIFRYLIREDLSKFDLSSLQYVTTAGEAINPEVFNKFYSHTGLKLMEAFGQTETTVLLGNFVGSQPKEGSMGKPSPQYDVDLVDDNDKSVEPGVIGEIVVRTNGVLPVGLFSGYCDDEELTKEAHHDGLYHTKDLAWRDEDGYFYYVSRKDDVIKSSGYRIGPFEIESVLMEHPAVLECAVTGIPDEVRGQVIKATIVLTQEYQNVNKDALAKEIQDFVKKTTAPYKYPRVVNFVDALPKTISGKIKRNEIK